MQLDIKSMIIGILIFTLLSAGTLSSGIVQLRKSTPKEIKILRITTQRYAMADYDATQVPLLQKYLLKGFVITDQIGNSQETNVLLILAKY